MPLHRIHPMSGSTPRSPLSRTASWMALAALLGTAWRQCRNVHQRRLAERPRAEPERVQVWEGEGGQNQMPKSPPS